MLYQLKSLAKTLVILCLAILTCYGTIAAQSISEQVPLGDASYHVNPNLWNQGWTWLHTRVAVNPATNRVYIPRTYTSVIEINGSDNSSSMFDISSQPFGVGVNPKTNRAYFPSSNDSLVAVLDVNTGNIQNILIPYPYPFSLTGEVAVNADTNRIYFPSVSGQVVAMNGSDNSIELITGPFLDDEGHYPYYYGVAANSRTNRVYLAGGSPSGDVLDVIDANNNIIRIPLPPNVQVTGAVAVNETTNRIYLPAKHEQIGAVILVINGDDNSFVTVPLPPVFQSHENDFFIYTSCITVNPETNRAYVVSHTPQVGLQLTTLDGKTNAVAVKTILPHDWDGFFGGYFEASGIAVNPETNLLYIPTRGSLLVVEPGSTAVAAPPDNDPTTIDPATVQADTATLTFANVISGGTTTVEPDQTTAANYSLSNNLGSYEITTTATYDTTGYYVPNTTTVADPTKGIKVSFSVPSINDEATFNNLVITHGEDANGDGIIEMVPYNGIEDPLKVTYHDFASHTVWVYVPHLSPFVIVKGEVNQIADLIGMVKSFNLKQGIYNSFDAKLENARNALEAAKGKERASACNQIGAFINEAKAQSGKALTVSQSNQLVSAAGGIKLLLGCR